MAGVSITFYVSNFFLIYGLSEFYYNKYLTTPFYLSKSYLLNTKTNVKLIGNSINKLIYCLSVQLIAGISWKLTKISYVFQFLTLHHYSLLLAAFIITTFFFIKVASENYTNILLLWFIVILNFFYFSSNLLVFVLLLEIIATIYYFFFLNTLDNNSITLIKLKNLIINYIWLSLLTLIFFCVMLVFLVHEVGTLDFSELNLLTSHISTLPTILLLFSVFWKIGLPGFHFFKYEIYRYLPLETIFYFSLFSVIVNLYLLIFIVLKLPILFTALKYFLLSFILLMNILLLSQGLDNLKLFQFLALSGLNTITTILMFVLL